MVASGANTHGIDHCLDQLQAGHSLEIALSHPSLLPSTRAFVYHTFETLTYPTHMLVASFVFGREGMIPDFFIPWLDRINQHAIPRCELLATYLARHIDLDADDHFPKALQLLVRLCGDDQTYWHQARKSAIDALKARLAFLDGVYTAWMNK